MVIGLNGRQGVSLAPFVRFVAVGLAAAAIYAAPIIALAQGVGLRPAASVAIADVVAAITFVSQVIWVFSRVSAV